MSSTYPTSIFLAGALLACAEAPAEPARTPEALLAHHAAEAVEPPPGAGGISRWADKTGRLRGEEEALLERLAATPDDPETRAELGRVYTEAGETGRALWYLTRALAERPDHAPSWVAFGDDVLLRGDAQGALVLYEHAAELDRDLTAAFARAGEACYRLERRELARERLEQALALNPSHLEARLGVARLLEEAGELEEARAQLERALDVDADSPVALFRLARVLRALGRDDEAAEAERAHERAAVLEDLRLREAGVPLATKLLALGRHFLADGRAEDAAREFAAAREAGSPGEHGARLDALVGLLLCARAGAGDAEAAARALAEVAPEHPLLRE